jgi:hypothetical protein
MLLFDTIWDDDSNVSIGKERQVRLLELRCAGLTGAKAILAGSGGHLARQANSTRMKNKPQSRADGSIR